MLRFSFSSKSAWIRIVQLQKIAYDMPNDKLTVTRKQGLTERPGNPERESKGPGQLGAPEKRKIKIYKDPYKIVQRLNRLRGRIEFVWYGILVEFQIFTKKMFVFFPSPFLYSCVVSWDWFREKIWVSGTINCVFLFVQIRDICDTNTVLPWLHCTCQNYITAVQTRAELFKGRLALILG